MPWMRVAIGVGAGGLMAGVAGMVAWIDNGSHYFELAVALASAGFLTLVACVLTRVFGSSHGSQDDAFRRGRSMGYDAGFLEGHRTARPVVVPLHGTDRDVDPDLDVPSHDIDDVDEVDTPATTMALWRRDPMAGSRTSAKDRVVGWVVAGRIPLVVGALGLAVVGVLVANALASTRVPGAALPLTPAKGIAQAAQTPGGTPPLMTKPGHSAWSVANGGRMTLAVSGAGGLAPAAADVAGVSAARLVSGAAVGQPVMAMSSVPGVAVVAPSTVYSPAATAPVIAPSAPTTIPVVPVVAAPAAPLTAAQQTAADALAAANLTKANALSAANLTAANALSAANLTAANAAAAAAETARVAAAAAEATKLQASAAAYAVAHPGG
jgi:hypothetical protein